MDKVKSNKENFLRGINLITGIEMEDLQEYTRNNEIFNIIDHPMEINATEEQVQKLAMLKEFVNSYQYLRKHDEENKASFNSPELMAGYFKSQIGDIKDKEYFLVAYLDASMHIMACEKIGGTIDACVVHPREILKRAIQLDCKGIAVSHNHPSGSVLPSKEDKKITNNLMAIFKSLGMSFFDHIIIAGNKYFSFAEEGLLDEVRLPNENDYTPVKLSAANREQELSL
jgi:DNA repair protein RadC